MSAVWIVREVAEIEDLLYQAEHRALSLSLKLRTHAADLKTSGHGSEKGLPAMVTYAGITETVAGEVGKLHAGIEPLLTQAAVAVKRAADMITEPERTE